MIRLAIAAGLLVGVILGIALFKPPPYMWHSGPDYDPGPEICEAVLRAKLKEYKPTLPIYLSLPSPYLQKMVPDRLRDLNMNFGDATQAAVGKGGVLRDVKTGKKVLRWSIGLVEAKNPSTVEVHFESFEAMDASTSETLKVEKIEGHWKVTGTVGDTIVN